MSFLASGGLWQKTSSLCLPLHMAVCLLLVPVCPFRSHIRTLSLDLGPTLIQYDVMLFLTLITSAKTYFQTQSRSEVLDECGFWGDTIQPAAMVKKHIAGSAENTICCRACKLFEPQNLGLSHKYSAQLSTYNTALHSVEQISR